MSSGTLAVIMVFSTPLVAVVGGFALEKIWKGAAPSTPSTKEPAEAAKAAPPAVGGAHNNMTTYNGAA